MLGGGRAQLLPQGEADPEHGPDYPGTRRDGRNIVREWVDAKRRRGDRASYTWNKRQFDAVNSANTDALIGGNTRFSLTQQNRSREIKRLFDTFAHEMGDVIEQESIFVGSEPNSSTMRSHTLDVVTAQLQNFSFQIQGGSRIWYKGKPP